MSTLPSLVPVKLFTSLGRKHWPLPRAWAVEVPAGCAAHPTSAAEPINERTSVEDLIMAIPLPKADEAPILYQTAVSSSTRLWWAGSRPQRCDFRGSQPPDSADKAA